MRGGSEVTFGLGEFALFDPRFNGLVKLRIKGSRRRNGDLVIGLDILLNSIATAATGSAGWFYIDATWIQSEMHYRGASEIYRMIRDGDNIPAAIALFQLKIMRLATRFRWESDNPDEGLA